MRKIKEFDRVLLKVFENKAFIVDVGNSPEDWKTISVTIEDIEKVLTK